MRQTFKGLVAAFAVLTASAAPAMACGADWYAPCDRHGYGVYGGYFSVGYAHQTLPAPQYYYVSQGPVYSGPGNLAPYPTYQEAAVAGYSNFTRRVAYGYDGGRYADALTHYYDGASARPYLRPWNRRYFGGHTVVRPRMVHDPRRGYSYRQWSAVPQRQGAVVR